MAIAFDAASNPTAGTGNLSWTHTPAGTPRGVVVFVVQNGSSADQVSGVTYGGVAMAEVALSPVAHAGPPACIVHAFFLGASVPTGAQTVVVTVGGASTKQACAISYTSASDVQVEDTSTIDAAVADPSITLTTSVVTAIAGVDWIDNSNAGNITPGASYTQALEHDFGSQVMNVERGTSTFSAGSPACNWTANNEAQVGIAVAMKEGAAAGAGRAMRQYRQRRVA